MDKTRNQMVEAMRNLYYCYNSLDVNKWQRHWTLRPVHMPYYHEAFHYKYTNGIRNSHPEERALIAFMPWERAGQLASREPPDLTLKRPYTGRSGEEWTNHKHIHWVISEQVVKQADFDLDERRTLHSDITGLQRLTQPTLRSSEDGSSLFPRSQTQLRTMACNGDAPCWVGAGRRRSLITRP